MFDFFFPCENCSGKDNCEQGCSELLDPEFYDNTDEVMFNAQFDRNE